MGFWCLDVMPSFGFTYGRRTAISNDKSFDSCPLLVNFTVTSYLSLSQSPPIRKCLRRLKNSASQNLIQTLCRRLPYFVCNPACSPRLLPTIATLQI